MTELRATVLGKILIVNTTALTLGIILQTLNAEKKPMMQSLARAPMEHSELYLLWLKAPHQGAWGGRVVSSIDFRSENCTGNQTTLTSASFKLLDRDRQRFGSLSTFELQDVLLLSQLI